jgi:MFS family permease
MRPGLRCGVSSVMNTVPSENEVRESRLSYPGWRVVLAAFFGVMVSFAALVPYTFSLFLAPLHEAFGWKREGISMAFGITAMTVAVCSPGIGHLLDRFPPRRIILPAIVIFSLGLASLSLLTSRLIHFYAVYLLLGVVGNATAQLAYSRTVSTWFSSKRGLAFALMLTGGGVGSILLPILAHHMIVNYGWRSAYLALGVTALVVGFPLTAVFVQEQPSVGDGRPHHADAGMSFGQAMRSRVLWILFASILLYAFSANGAIAHLSAILVGYGAGSGAAALSAMGAAGIAGRLATGYLLDRFFAPRVSFFLLLMVCGALVMLAHAHTAAWGIVCAAILGFGMGSEIDVTPYLLARYCGLKSLSMLYGCSWTAYAFGAAFGPVLVGKAFDLRGGYAPGLIELLALPCLIAAGLTLLMPAYAQGPATSPQAVPETLLSPPAIAE